MAFVAGDKPYALKDRSRWLLVCCVGWRDDGFRFSWILDGQLAPPAGLRLWVKQSLGEGKAWHDG